MKTHLYIYGFLVFIFILYNAWFQVEDEKLNTIINILLSSILFLYIGYLAYIALKKIKKASKK
ncbi:hypothetical protein BPO_2158 [Bergeyella porcorum]|uniref:Uncharacterized protein n=1 Tax=Bergeyella porcorum TaxID=1735111 RepID=A0AAU0F7M8_9FLAO